MGTAVLDSEGFEIEIWIHRDALPNGIMVHHCRSCCLNLHVRSFMEQVEIIGSYRWVWRLVKRTMF